MMLKQPQYIALGLVLLMTLILWNLPARMTEALKLAIGSIFVPLIGVTGTGHQLADRAGDAMLSRSELLRQVEDLRKENQQLKIQEVHSHEVERENARLREAVGWKAQRKWEMKLGRVIMWEPANWWRTVQIDLGSRDGVATNMPVLTVDGLVGRIAAVSLTKSQVVLLGDPNCKVSAAVRNESNVTGVMVPYGTLEGSLVSLEFLPANANVKPGQNVVTSGIGGVFPPGILIGKIVDAHSADYGLSTEARVKLAANLNALNEVWVLLKQ